MKLALSLLFISLQAFALDAVVTVLETPMLSAKSLDAPVVQYLRKGDVIKIHPALNKNSRYEHMAPSQQKIRKIQARLVQSKELQDDPFLERMGEEPLPHDEFIPTLDRLGNTVYVIKDHLYVYFETPAEFNQDIIRPDPTDYRLEEPLPKNYPLYSPTGYRGIFIFGITQPYFESYPYASKAKTKGYMSPLDLNVAFLRQAPDDKYDRFFIGGNLNLRVFSNSYTFFNGRMSEERGLKIGLGPYIAYDAFKGVKDRLNLYGVINVYLFNQLNITQSDAFTSDERNFQAYNVSPRIGVQYHRKQILEDLDFILGSSMEFELPSTYRAHGSSSQAQWWQKERHDRFQTRTSFTLAGYIGFQSAY
jgi:hypothetical protein